MELFMHKPPSYHWFCRRYVLAPKKNIPNEVENSSRILRSKLPSESDYFIQPSPNDTTKFLIKRYYNLVNDWSQGMKEVCQYWRYLTLTDMYEVTNLCSEGLVKHFRNELFSSRYFSSHYLSFQNLCLSRYQP